VAVVFSVSICVGDVDALTLPMMYEVLLLPWHLLKAAPIYASVAEDITSLRTLLMIKISPLVSYV
jgi:hypothetical protein